MMKEQDYLKLFHKKWTQQLTDRESELLYDLMKRQDIADQYTEMENIWNKSEAYTPSATFNPSAAEMLLKKRIAESEPVNRPEADPRRIMGMKPALAILRVAAVFLLLIFASFALYNFLATATNDHSTTESQIKSIVLADGSNLWLNENSEITVPRFNIGERLVLLDGEAYFEVEKAEGKKFTIESELGRVTVLGTSFNVNTTGTSGLEVTVDEGKVLVEDLESTTQQTLTVMEGAVLYAQTNQIEKSSLKSPNTGAWRNQVLRFEETTLEVVFQDLSEVFGASFDLNSDLNLNCSFSSPINKSLEEAIQALSTVYPNLQVESTSNSSYTVSGTACK